MQEESRQRMEQMRAESEQRMQELRGGAGPTMESRTTASEQSTMDTLRPYRRLIRWGIGILVVGAIAMWRMLGKKKSAA